MISPSKFVGHLSALFLIYYNAMHVRMFSCSESQLFATPWTVAQGFSVHGISQAEILEWVAISFSRGFSWSRDWTQVSCIFTIDSLQSWILYNQDTWEAPFSSVQSFSSVQLFATPWTAACQASLSIINSWSLLKLMSIELMMPSNHLILCYPLLFLPSMFSSIRVFSNESVLVSGAKVLELHLQHQSFQWIFRTDFL